MMQDTQPTNPRTEYLKTRYENARRFVTKLTGDIKRTYPGSKAFHRVYREIKEAQRDTILWEGRLMEAQLEEAA